MVGLPHPRPHPRHRAARRPRGLAGRQELSGRRGVLHPVGQQAEAATISQLTLEHLHTSDIQVRLRLGREPVILPEPVDALVRQLAATRRGRATLGDQGTSPWLFQGGQPRRPITALWLADRLRRLGVRARPSRSTALLQLATELPAAVLARMLGIHISVAAAWQRASVGDWTQYAAEISRRNNR
jgi:hypothetical protein